VLAGRLIRGVEEGLFGIEGHDIPHEFLVLVDGEQVYSAEIGGIEDHELSVEEGINVANAAIDEKLTSPPIPITAGPHEVAFTWRERPEREAERMGAGAARDRSKFTILPVCRASRWVSSKGRST
jgi:hypothetical protein